jgi:cysteine desulfurase/selenocysteine lyase
MALSVKSIKSHFPIFAHRPELVYLDNAATSQKPRSVIQTITDFYEKENANIHRGFYDLSSTATRRYEEVRKKVSNLISANDARTIAFTKGATESINTVAQGFARKKLTSGDNIVISAMEHHANIIPWQQVCRQTGATLRILPITPQGDLDLTVLTSLLDEGTKLVACTHISNVLGTINPVEEIISIAHKKNIPVLIDASQSAGHYPIDSRAWDADFIVFSAHKMFGPMGTGVLYAKHTVSNDIESFHYGGGGIKNVSFAETEFLSYPHKLEAGTANVPGVIGLGTAIDFIHQLDLTETSRHTRALCIYFKQRLTELRTASVLGNPSQFGSITSFGMANIHPHDVASFLAHANIAVRAGHHCAQPLLESMGIPATVRVSFSIYNTKKDIDQTMDALAELKTFWE